MSLPARSQHVRVNDTFLAPLERVALRWLAAHMPDWVHPDLLTAFGFFGTLLVFAGYILTNYSPWFLWLASLGFVLNWFGDSLDGTLARYRNIERPKYGFFVDHTVDLLDQLFIFIGLGLSPYVHFEIALFALIGYFLLSAMAYIDTIVTGRFQISYARLGPTEMRILTILTNAAIFFIGNPLIRLPWVQWMPSLYDLLLLLVVVLFFFGFLLYSSLKAAELARLEPPERKAHKE
jgi:phosphatidylglycerophosphate synthase